MDAVFALADRISVLVYGKVVFSGPPDAVRRHPEVRAAYLGEEASARRGLWEKRMLKVEELTGGTGPARCCSAWPSRPARAKSSR